VGVLVGEAMAVGATNVQVLAALDGAHTSAFGAPTPTPVNHAQVAGKAILISGERGEGGGGGRGWGRGCPLLSAPHWLSQCAGT
jgi:hydroxylamine reductase (hybrid-cluster protein)